MKAAAFDYARAESLEAALALLGRFGTRARLIAGGQSLMPALNLRLLAPELLVDISTLAELRGIVLADGVLRIGAATRHVDLLADPLIAAHAPLLAQAAAQIAHPAIRNRGTIGGSLAHADPAAELPACILALGGRMRAQSQRGSRVIAADDFFTGLFATALEPDEILTGIEIDAPDAAQRTGFAELARRHGDYALVGLAACASRHDSGLAALRLAYFSVGSRPILAREAASLLVGRPITPDAVAQAGAALVHDLDPPDDLHASAATRLVLAKLLLKRVIPMLHAGDDA